MYNLRFCNVGFLGIKAQDSTLALHYTSKIQLIIPIRATRMRAAVPLLIVIRQEGTMQKVTFIVVYKA